MNSHRLEDRGMLVEGQEDESTKPEDQESAGSQPTVEPSLKIGPRLLSIQRCESPSATGEQRGAPFKQSQSDRQTEAREERKARQRAIDLEQHVFVDGLIEAVAARAERVDHGAKDGRRARREVSRPLVPHAVRTTLPTFLRSWM